GASPTGCYARWAERGGAAGLEAGGMQVPPGSVVELRSDSLEVVGVSRLQYEDHPPLRDQVQQLVHDLVVRHALTLFGNVCGRCGNSCRREGVVVREVEIFPIRTRLGMTEQEFREAYLSPASTWNPGDGVIRLRDGACPFLQPGREGGVAACGIYDLRPADCRMFASNSSICRKHPGRLIEGLAWIRLEGPDEMVVGLKDGTRHALTDERPFWELVMAQLELVDPGVQGRLLRIAERTGALVRSLLDEPRLEEPAFQEQVNGLRQLVGDLAHIGNLGHEQPAILERLWADLRRLEAPGPPVPELPSAPARGPESPVLWMHLTEDGVTALYSVPPTLMRPGQAPEIPVYLNFHFYPVLQERAQAVLFPLLTHDEDAFQVTLTEPDPPCFLCGECCRVYTVEILPTDIDRLCELLGLSPPEFVEKYTTPGRFSWNAYNRVLKKEAREPRYGHKEPRLFRLPLAGEKDRRNRGCVFLEEREDGLWYCGVHSHKPDVCRKYQANTPLCRSVNQLAHWGRQARSLMWVRVERERVSVMPFSDAREGRPAREFGREGWPALDRACQALHREVDEILEKARQELEAAGV
ncbi:MAG: YkgJ family cysteine cluster protein, partial [Candidatus Eremiobacterota bacterium]